MDFDVTIFRQYFDQADTPQRDVLAAYLFGSLARGQALPSSDVDIAVLLKGDFDAFAQAIIKYMETESE